MLMLRARPAGFAAVVACLAAALICAPAQAQVPFRIAVYHTGLGRDGPGLLLRDIRRGAADVMAVRDAIAALHPDAVLLLDIDHDHGGVALAALGSLLADVGQAMPHTLAPRPNTGMATGLDLDGDGRRGTADDAQGWGRFAGAGGMALLSRAPIQPGSLRDYSHLLWRDQPGARLPRVNGQLFPSDAVFAVQWLSSTGHWEVTLDTPSGPLTLMAWHAGPPVYGGPHQRNHNRNADETAFWRHRLNGDLNGDFGPLPANFVLIGGANLDPDAGAGDRSEIAALLAHPLIHDPAPMGQRPGTAAASRATAFWPDGPGALRVDYLLPSVGVRVLDSGVIWPTPTARHALIWADLTLPP